MMTTTNPETHRSDALASRRTELALPETAPATRATPLDRDLSRRHFIRASFWTGLGVSLAGSAGLMVDFLDPRNVAGSGGPVAAGNVQNLPAGGEPQVFSSGQVNLVNLDPDETRAGGFWTWR
jgi:hypothetical protein